MSFDCSYLSTMEKDQKVLPTSLSDAADHALYRIYRPAGRASHQKPSAPAVDSNLILSCADVAFFLAWCGCFGLPALLSLGWERACAGEGI